MISRDYFYKIEMVEGAHVTLTIAQVHSRYPFPPTAHEVLGGLLTGWRMLFTSLGYQELPITREQARALYLSAPSFERMATLYANYCPHNEPINRETYLLARSNAEAAAWSLGGRSFKGVRDWVSRLSDQRTYGVMALGHIHDYKTQVRDETETLLLDFSSTLLGGAGRPAARVSFRAGESSLMHFLRPGMVWEFTDEYECPHCLTNAAYIETGRAKSTGPLLPGDRPDQRSKVDVRICQCSLCGGTWKEDLSIVNLEKNHP